MAKENSKEPVQPGNANTASQRSYKVPRDKLKQLPEECCHREDGDITAEAKDLFRRSVILEGGVRVPVVFHTDFQGRQILISGHRRIRRMSLLG